MKFYQVAGKMALGSRLRKIGERLMQDAENIYPLYGVDIDPRWFPVFYSLNMKKQAGITELAEYIDQSHAAVSQVVSKMQSKGLVESNKSDADGRINKITLSNTGKDIAKRLESQCIDVDDAISQLFEDTGSNLWAELDAFELELSSSSLLERVKLQRQKRECQHIQIVEYRDRYKHAFKQLNEDWISQYFEMEDSDYKALDNPKRNIINAGGAIIIALYKGEPVGTCALIKMPSNCFELAKMAVSKDVQGLGIGNLLGQSIIQKAKQLGAKKIYLESNTKLSAALSLYRKLGFKRIATKPSPYTRCDIQMALSLHD